MRQNPKISFTLYGMIGITLILVAATIIYLSQSVDTSKNTIPLNGPWKFTVGDNRQFAQSSYDDSGWETVDLTAPPGAHDDDVGLSGYIPGWTAKGHANYSGYGWYRLKVPLDSISGNKLALAAPPAVDEAYQLFINGTLAGSAGKFSGKVPIAYSIQPRMFLLPENVKKEKTVTIAFRVWMSSTTQGPDVGGIHIAPTLGEITAIKEKYRFQWEQTIKGYVVEVVWPILFVLLAMTMFWLNHSGKQTQSSNWFIAALLLLGLVRFNQALYFWFQLVSNHQSIILGIGILRPLMLASWLMAWREWFELHQPKWLPKLIALLTLLYMTAQLLGLPWITNPIIHTYFQPVGAYVRLLILALMLYIIYQGIRRQGKNDLLVWVALILLTTALFPKEVSDLHIIPGIWFPYGVGVSRAQFIYPVFVLVMYILLIQKNRQVKVEQNN